MSRILKAILAEHREWKMANIFERAKTMDTVEIYDELYGRHPPLPPPACARLQHINPWPSWGMMWWPGDPEPIRWPLMRTIFNPEAITPEMDKLMETARYAMDILRGSVGLREKWPHYVGMITDFERQPVCSVEHIEGGYRIGYSIDFAVKISLRGRRKMRRHQLRPRNPFRKPLIYKYV